MVKVVYFNQWFSSIAWVIEDLKKRNKNQIKVIASSRNKNHAYKDYVDEFIVEDWKETDNHEESMNNYVNWTLNLCKEYKVDYFFVKKHSVDIARQRTKFGLQGTFLIVENYNKLNVLESKTRVYDELLEVPVLKDYIPEYYNTNSSKCSNDSDRNGIELIRKVLEHRGKNDLCMKFDSDEGGASFRAIDDTPVNIDSLYKYRVNKLTTDEAIKVIVTADKPEKLILMEMLDSPEISVDCYNSKQGFIAICRAKEEGRVEKIYYNPEISKVCKLIGEKLGLIFPYNVQFRYKAGTSDKERLDNLRLLEINPRMSGGLYYEVFKGLNIADVCLKDCMNREDEYNINDFIDFETKYVTHLELPLDITK